MTLTLFVVHIKGMYGSRHNAMDKITKELTILNFLLKCQARNYSCLSEVIYFSVISKLFLFSFNPDGITGQHNKMTAFFYCSFF